MALARFAQLLEFVSGSIATVIKPAGVEKSKGVVAGTYIKDENDARWKDDPGQEVSGVLRNVSWPDRFY